MFGIANNFFQRECKQVSDIMETDTECKSIKLVYDRTIQGVLEKDKKNKLDYITFSKAIKPYDKNLMKYFNQEFKQEINDMKSETTILRN